jgi:hypothetical protein
MLPGAEICIAAHTDRDGIVSSILHRFGVPA